MGPHNTYACPVQRPPFRRLRAYAFDPSLETELENAVLNQATLSVRWECDPRTGASTLQPGPVGEYLEVIDFDPASNCFYMPVDLNHPYLLAQDGLAPSEGNPQFHQQMVYAVAMTTIRNFEHALGRLALWSPHIWGEGKNVQSEYVQRLRIYPHAMREANAYYSPQKKALLFGYFPASPVDPGSHLPGELVFTCLSQDVVAHETTHALLDGSHRRFIEASNPDVLAFHEGFADIVALLQHFTFPEVLRSQIAKTRGDLARQNLLGQLAQQFGQATGRYSALRDALGAVDPETHHWHPKEPDPTELDRTTEPHARGSLLVAAVFDAFLSIYKSRIADLVRLASGGTGILTGEVHPDLVNRMAQEAAKAAQHLLTMCIRALDYCPPIDLTFGEYLRALITADYDLVRDDDRGYRVAVVEAFRRRGIYPRDVRTLSIDSLLWQHPDDEDAARDPDWMLPYATKLGSFIDRWDLSCDRAEAYHRAQMKRAALHEWIEANRATRAGDYLGLNLAGDLKFEVHSIRPARRVGPDGQSQTDIVIEITQKKPAYFSDDPAQQDPEHPDFWFRGGSTLLVDPESGEIRYRIMKRIDSETRLARQKEFLLNGAGPSLRALYFGSLTDPHSEPFAFLHRSNGEVGDERHRERQNGRQHERTRE